MMPFSKILFPVDFSEASAAMIPYVAEMAQRFKANVTILNAFDLVPDLIVTPSPLDAFRSEPTPIPYTIELQEIRKQRQKRLEEFWRPDSTVNYTTRLEDGDPANVIEWVAQRENTDLIMMATKGHGRFRRMLFGSVTAKVLHDLHCPVLTSAHETGHPPASSAGYRSILCAVGLNPEAEVVLEAAAFLAQAYQARISLVHFEPSSQVTGGTEAAQWIQSAFERALNPGARGVGEISVRVLDASVPEGIRHAAKEQEADLLVVGRGHQIEHLSRIWSNLYTIIRESPCPVLSV